MMKNSRWINPTSARLEPERMFASRALPAVVTFTLCIVLTAWVYYANNKVGMAAAREVFQQDWDSRVAAAKRDFENQLNLTYDAIRTMAMLPGVSNIDRYGENFEGDPRMTVQQLYNNIASHVAVSEIYIVPGDIEPDQMDPNTGRLQEPITTFDEIIVGRSADKAIDQEAEELEEVEIFEYREMKKQCQYFADKYPTRDAITGLNYPAITSREVVTCDNSEFSSSQLASHDDRSRNGIVYSVPFYAPDGKFKGIVCAVLRTRMISKTFKEPYFALAYPRSDFSVFSPRFSQELNGARTEMSVGVAPSGFAFARAEHCNVRDDAPWTLTCAVPERVFTATAAARAVNTRGHILLGAGVAVGLLLACVIWQLSTMRWRAEMLARRMTMDLAQSERRFRALVENIPGAVYRCHSTDRQKLDYISEGVVEITGRDAASVMASDGKSLINIIAPEDRARVEQELREAINSTSNNCRYLNEYRICRADGKTRWVQDRGQVVGNDGERHIEGLLLDVTDRREAEVERERMHQELQLASRRAGMAEIATGVLHNVGNVLNSLNVSASFVSERLRQSKVSNLGKAAQMFGEHQNDLAHFLTNDERGKRLPGYVMDIAKSLVDEQISLLDELKAVGKNIEHIRAIVDTQQSYAKGSTLLSPIQPAELLEHAARVSIASFERHNIRLTKELIDVPPVMLDQHKILQILINLVSNAKKAVTGLDDKHVRLRLEVSPPAETGNAPAVVRFQVIDNGVGIPKENLQRIFSHGFTTAKNGHGFGLHSSANAAGEMGGKLTAMSDGPGCGATFTLEIPVQNAPSPESKSMSEVERS